MTKTITLADLRGACIDQRNEFARRFPDGVTFASEDDAVAQCVAVAGVFNWDWAAKHLLWAPAREAYDAAEAKAREAYEAAKATAFARAFWNDAVN